MPGASLLNIRVCIVYVVLLHKTVNRLRYASKKIKVVTNAWCCLVYVQCAVHNCKVIIGLKPVKCVPYELWLFPLVLFCQSR